jgi:dGTPase
VKDRTYKIEELFLSKYAKKSIETKGREIPEIPCLMRTDFQRDRDRIIHSKSFRRLKNKTQVFLSPENDHYRTRLTHTLDVSQIARSIARGLSLNEDLAEAIALGHDLGHTPFGHAGERVLNTLSPDGFRHNEQSLRVVDVLENDGKGLNLTFEVRDGIVNHKKTGKPATLEGYAVSLADRIAYVNHDIDDALRAGILKLSDLPEKETKILGITPRERINTLILSIYNESNDKNYVALEKEKSDALENLRTFMFEKVYITKSSKIEEEKALRMLSAMYNYYLLNKDKLPEFYVKLLERYKIEQVICDYLSTMSDKYAVYVFESLFVPKSWTLSGELK